MAAYFLGGPRSSESDFELPPFSLRKILFEALVDSFSLLSERVDECTPIFAPGSLTIIALRLSLEPVNDVDEQY
jgi:hypothetical protein